MKKATALRLQPGDVLEFVDSFHLLSAGRGTHLKGDRCVVKHNWPDHKFPHLRDIRIEDAAGSVFHFWIAFSWNYQDVTVRYQGARMNVVVPWWELFKKVRKR